MYLKEKNIPVLPPNINKSKPYFSVENKCVRIGLVAIKNVGLNAIEAIIEERTKSGEFTSFENFISRCAGKLLNKRLVENLILAGAFDCFNIARAKLLAVYEELLDRVQVIAKQRESNQISLFDSLIPEDNMITVKYPENVEEFDQKTKLMKEKSVIGVYVSGHPLEGFMDKFKGFFTTEALQYFEEDDDGEKFYTEIKDGTHVTMGGLISSWSRITTKRGDYMAYIMLEDVYGQIECVLFPKTYEKVKNNIKEEEILKVSGTLKYEKGSEPKVLVDSVEIFEDEPEQKIEEKPKAEASRDWLVITIPEGKENLQDEIIETLTFYEGDINVGLKVGGKKLHLKNIKVRRCNALESELQTFLDEEDYVFFRA